MRHICRNTYLIYVKYKLNEINFQSSNFEILNTELQIDNLGNVCVAELEGQSE